MLSWSVPRGLGGDNPCLVVPKLKGWRRLRCMALGDDPARQGAPARRPLARGWRRALLRPADGRRVGDALGRRQRQYHHGGAREDQKATCDPLHEDLRRLLAEIPKTAVTILTSTAGTPWTRDGFKTSWQKAFAEPKLHAGLVFHGLRKSAVVFLLEAGCSDAEVAAITG